jgi:hypothetical protein
MPMRAIGAGTAVVSAGYNEFNGLVYAKRERPHCIDRMIR